MIVTLKAVFISGLVAFDIILLTPVLLYRMNYITYIAGIIVAISCVPIFVLLRHKDAQIAHMLKVLLIFGFTVVDVFLLAFMLLYPLRSFPYLATTFVALSIVVVFILLRHKDTNKQDTKPSLN